MKIMELSKRDKEYLNNQNIICGLGTYQESLNEAYAIIGGESFHKLRGIVHKIGMGDKSIEELIISIKEIVEREE